MRVNDAQFQQLSEQGYVVIEDFVKGADLAQLQENTHDYLPTWEEFEKAPVQPTKAGMPQHQFGFPYRGAALNDLITGPDVLDAAERISGTPEVALTRVILWGKYGSTETDFGQSHHTDHGNNTLVYPRDEPGLAHVPMILYLSDVTEETGPTHIVSLEHTGDFIGQRWVSAEEAPELYEREVAVTAPAGSLLIYTMRTFHRGTAFKARHGTRHSLHFVYRPAACQWMTVESWAGLGDAVEMNEFLAHATPRQREVLGFPKPADPYWNEEMIEMVARRYPTMDMAPYRDAVAATS